MSYTEKATALHESGCNCCQAVIMCCCQNYGISEEQAYHLGAFFGSGMRQGHVCGAVSGALMALGLRYGDENNRKSKASKTFLDSFRKEFGSVVCRELLAQNKEKRCPVFINYAAKYLEDECI